MYGAWWNVWLSITLNASLYHKHIATSLSTSALLSDLFWGAATVYTECQVLATETRCHQYCIYLCIYVWTRWRRMGGSMVVTACCVLRNKKWRDFSCGVGNGNLHTFQQFDSHMRHTCTEFSLHLSWAQICWYELFSHFCCCLSTLTNWWWIHVSLWSTNLL